MNSKYQFQIPAFVANITVIFVGARFYRSRIWHQMCTHASVQCTKHCADWVWGAAGVTAERCSTGRQAGSGCRRALGRTGITSVDKSRRHVPAVDSNDAVAVVLVRWSAAVELASTADSSTEPWCTAGLSDCSISLPAVVCSSSCIHMLISMYYFMQLLY